MEAQNFDSWFKELLAYAKESEFPDLIDAEDPDAYMEYYDDGDSPADCFDAESEAKDDEDA